MDPNRLGKVELEIYQIVVRLGTASVQDVVNEINRDRKTAYTSVMTLMKNLADKGFLSFEKSGKKYLYRPKVAPEDLQQSLLERTLDRVFEGSAVDLVQSLVNSERVSTDELVQIRKLLDEMEE
jgi:BlaI family penicillinase repressor